MNDVQLTQVEAERLINMLKTSLINILEQPDSGNSFNFDVQGETNRDIFTINIFCSKIKNKINYNARIKALGTVLLELHINATNKHFDPISGNTIIGSHWHIYKEGYGHKHAYPATDINSNDFTENTLKFFKEFNIIKYPQINEQLRI